MGYGGGTCSLAKAVAGAKEGWGSSVPRAVNSYVCSTPLLLVAALLRAVTLTATFVSHVICERNYCGRDV